MNGKYNRLHSAAFTMVLIMFCALVLSWSSMAQANTFPERQAFAGHHLQLNGKGTRYRLLFGLYDAGLYLQKNSHDANDILSADLPMALRLQITSGLITSESMESAVQEGFKKSSGSRLPGLQSRIEQLIATFREPIQEGDIYDFIYQPQKVLIIKNGQQAAVINGFDFKYALFSIWLGHQPVQKSLKKALLGLSQ